MIPVGERPGRGFGKRPLREREGDQTFARNLRRLLRRQGMTARSLSLLLGEDERRFRRLADGTTLPHYAEIPSIARLLGVRPEALAWGDAS